MLKELAAAEKLQITFFYRNDSPHFGQGLLTDKHQRLGSQLAEIRGWNFELTDSFEVHHDGPGKAFVFTNTKLCTDARVDSYAEAEFAELAQNFAWKLKRAAIRDHVAHVFFASARRVPASVAA